MRVLITGSLGTLGVPLTFELSERGHIVFGCDLQHTAQESDTYTRCDVGDYRQLERVFAKYHPEVVYHLAAEFGRHNGNRHYEQVWRSNLIGTHNVLELCERYSSKLIFASTSEIYGTCEAEFLTEDLSETVALRQPNEYALSKWANEQQIMNYCDRHDVEAVRLRFFNVYGPGETYHPYRSVVALFCHRALNEIPWTVYEGYSRTFCYVDDFIPTVANALQLGEAGEVYNIGGEDYRLVSELSDLVLELTGADPDLVSYQPEDVHNVLSKRPDNTKAKAKLLHNPRTKLEEGVPATIDWMLGRTPIAA
jgi:dTDP-glucose 4,6-dehydratase